MCSGLNSVTFRLNRCYHEKRLEQAAGSRSPIAFGVGLCGVKTCQWRGPLHPQYQPLERLLSGYDELLLLTQSRRSRICLLTQERLPKTDGDLSNV